MFAVVRGESVFALEQGLVGGSFDLTAVEEAAGELGDEQVPGLVADARVVSRLPTVMAGEAAAGGPGGDRTIEHRVAKSGEPASGEAAVLGQFQSLIIVDCLRKRPNGLRRIEPSATSLAVDVLTISASQSRTDPIPSTLLPSATDSDPSGRAPKRLLEVLRDALPERLPQRTPCRVRRFAVLIVRIDGGRCVEDGYRPSFLAMRAGVVATTDVEGAGLDPAVETACIDTEHGGNLEAGNTRPGDYDRLAEGANDGAGEDDLVFKLLLDSPRWVDDAAIVVDADVRSAETEAPGARWAREDRHKPSARAVQGFEAVVANMSADAVPCFEQIMVDLVHRKKPPSTKGPTARSARAGLTSAQECARMMGDVRRQRTI